MINGLKDLNIYIIKSVDFNYIMPTNTKDYSREYYNKNKAKWTNGYIQIRIQPIVCECCNRTVQRKSYVRHMSSAKHILKYKEANNRVDERPENGLKDLNIV